MSTQIAYKGNILQPSSVDIPSFTTAEWEALSEDKKKSYEIVYITDDSSSGDLVVSQEVREGDFNPITSDAVADALSQVYKSGNFPDYNATTTGQRVELGTITLPSPGLWVVSTTIDTSVSDYSAIIASHQVAGTATQIMQDRALNSRTTQGAGGSNQLTCFWKTTEPNQTVKLMTYLYKANQDYKSTWFYCKLAGV